MPYFICPRCAWRGNRSSRTEGFSARPNACENCGFGFLFELLDDYFASPRTGIFVCDQQGRILALGRGAQELCGFPELDVMGLGLAEALGLETPEEPDAQQPHLTALEWGARVLGKSMTLHTAGDTIVPVTGDFFPALDDDGGLLAAFTPRGN